MTAARKEEFPTIVIKNNSLLSGRELSKRNDSDRDEVVPAGESVDSDITEQTFEEHPSRNISTSEAATNRLYLQAQEMEQRKSKLRRKAAVTADASSKRRRKNPRKETLRRKATSTTDTSSKRRRKNQREKTSKCKATSTTDASSKRRRENQREESLRRKATSTTDTSSKRRRINQRKETLRCKATSMTNASSKFRCKNQDATNDSEAENSRTTTIDELQKDISLTTMKPYDNSVTVNILSLRISERIITHNKNRKNRLTVNRELAGAKLFRTDNLAANVAALSDTSSSVSEIAGHRLYIQAQLSAEKKETVIHTVRSTPPPQLELATQQRSSSIDWGRSSTERFFALYEQGKNRIKADRELEMRFSVNRDLSNRKIIARYASVRQIELYGMGKKRLLNQITNEKKLKGLFDEKIIARYANKRQVELYGMGKQRILNQISNEKKLNGLYDREIIARYANRRQIELHEMGTQRIINQILSEKYHNALSDEDIIARYANRRQIELHEMGRQRIINQRLTEKRNVCANI